VTLIKDLFKLKYGTEITDDDYIPFIFYLKTKFLKEFDDDGYNRFQLQIFFESFIENYPVKEDLDLDKNYPQSRSGGGYSESTPKMSGGKKIVVDAAEPVNIQDCKYRTAEGKYINKFLEEMRTGIAKYVASQGNRNGVPSFFSKCLPLQCNPAFKDCLGINNYPTKTAEQIKTESYGELVDTIKMLSEKSEKSVEPGKPIVFCVFCILNLSEPPLAVDPPPVPYVDLTRLQLYYNELENLIITDFGDKNAIMTNIKTEIGNIIGSEQYQGQSGTAQANTMYELLKNANDLMDFSIITKSFIQFMSNINAATPIGTIMFADAVAKNFIEVNTCNEYQPVIYTKSGGANKSASDEPISNDGGAKGGASNYEYHINDDMKAEPKPTKSGGNVKRENTRKTIYNLTNHTGKSRTIRRK
jgi:hypothetical protein